LEIEIIAEGLKKAEEATAQCCIGDIWAIVTEDLD
jgi:hypothetical protein